MTNPKQIEIAMNCRASKVKALVGPEPHYRELLGAVVLMSVRSITYRQAENQMRACAGRRCYWKFKIKKVRLQQTQCEINSGNDYVGTPHVLGLQSMQSFAVIESVRSFASVMKSESSKSNERYELIHRKINYFH